MISALFDSKLSIYCDYGNFRVWDMTMELFW